MSSIATETPTHAMDLGKIIRREDQYDLAKENICISVRNFNLYYGEKQALKNISMVIPEKRVTAFIGPSGCGKSTLLRCFNRMNDLIDSVRIEGEITMHGENINDKKVNVAELRRRVGIVFQKPNPFPKSIYENVAYGPRIHGLFKNKTELDEIIEKSLARAGLWGEVKDRLHQPATRLSGEIGRASCRERVYVLV